MINVALHAGLKVVGNEAANAYVYTRQDTKWTVTHVSECKTDVYIVTSDTYVLYRRKYPSRSHEDIYELIDEHQRNCAFPIRIRDFVKRFDIEEISNRKVASQVLERHDW